MKVYRSKINDKIPFPQANDIYKLIYFLNKHTTNNFNDMLSHEKFKIVPRQVDYYKTAAKYLDLYDGETTSFAKHIFSINYEEMLKHMVYIILSKDIFYEFFKNRDKKQVVIYLKDKYHYSDKTANRRYSTLFSWVKWCDVVIEDYSLNIE